VLQEARRLVPVGTDLFGREQKLAPAAARAWHAMLHAAAADGIELQLVSAFRSVDYQRQIVQRKLARGLAITEVLRTSAAPGFSEHHTGRAIDVTTPGSATLEESFERTAAFDWLTRCAAGFGFRLSFPRGNRHAVAYEPWHWCHIGRLRR
jgi:D-alanyl-D-alanine carboxypeptidase